MILVANRILHNCQLKNKSMKVKLNKTKNIDSNFLRLSPPNEKEKEIFDSLILEDKSVEFWQS